jgi:hypothetical protein
VSVSEEHLRRSVDDALDPVWPTERRLATPWTFYAFIGGLTTVAALHEARDPDHLRRD